MCRAQCMPFNASYIEVITMINAFLLREWLASFTHIVYPIFLSSLPISCFLYPHTLFSGKSGWWERSVADRKWELKMLILLLLGLKGTATGRNRERGRNQAVPFLFQVLLVNLCEGTFLMSVSVWVQIPCRPTTNSLALGSSKFHYFNKL